MQDDRSKGKNRSKGQTGLSLLEVAVALGLTAVLIPVILQALVALINHGDFVYDRSILMERAQSALESIQSQSYLDDASQYAAVTAPDGYSIAISGETPVTYVYPSPASTSTPQTLQKITIAVTGVRGDMTLEGYKVRR